MQCLDEMCRPGYGIIFHKITLIFSFLLMEHCTFLHACPYVGSWTRSPSILSPYASVKTLTHLLFEKVGHKNKFRIYKLTIMTYCRSFVLNCYALLHIFLLSVQQIEMFYIQTLVWIPFFFNLCPFLLQFNFFPDYCTGDEGQFFKSQVNPCEPQTVMLLCCLQYTLDHWCS